MRYTHTHTLPSVTYLMNVDLQVSGGTVTELLAGLRSLGKCKALGVLEEALLHSIDQETKAANQKMGRSATMTEVW